MTQFTHNDGDEETKQDAPIVSPDPDTPGPGGGDYKHPEGVPGDDVVDNSQLGG